MTVSCLLNHDADNVTIGNQLQVKRDEGQARADEWGATFMETSAKTKVWLSLNTLHSWASLTRRWCGMLPHLLQVNLDECFHAVRSLTLSQLGQCEWCVKWFRALFSIVTGCSRNPRCQGSTSNATGHQHRLPLLHHVDTHPLYESKSYSYPATNTGTSTHTPSTHRVWRKTSAFLFATENIVFAPFPQRNVML